MNIKNLCTKEQINYLSSKYSGVSLNTSDKIYILEYIGTKECLDIAEKLKNPVDMTYTRPKSKGPYKSYYQSDLYKLMLIM